MTKTVCYTTIPTPSGTQFFTAFTFRFSNTKEEETIATYARTEAELREEVEGQQKLVFRYHKRKQLL